MTNAEILAALPSYDAINERWGHNRDVLADLQIAIEKDGDVLRNLATVSEVYKGVALWVFGDPLTRCCIRGVGDDIGRFAEVYLNAHNKTTWGLILKSYEWPIDKHFGNQWDRDAVLEAAKHFVATGGEPCR